jgi:hypothetical protein
MRRPFNQHRPYDGAMSVILAHQGGWDEMLMVLGPILLIAGLLRLAKHRVEARQAAERRPDDPATGPPTA